MRNLAKYPVTIDEKISAVERAIERYDARFTNDDERPIGSIEPVALQELLHDLKFLRIGTIMDPGD